MFRIDLHVHCKERSGCGRSPAEDQIKAAIAAGLDAIVLTDHDRFAPPDLIGRYNRDYAPFRIFPGIELSADSDEPWVGEHVIAIGLREPDLEARRWHYRDIHGLARSQGAFIAVAHLFRFHEHCSIDLDGFKPDALEIHSCNIEERNKPRIRAEAKRLGLPLVADSDGHHVSNIGMYWNELPRAPADEKELVAMLKAGESRPAGSGTVRIKA